MEKRAAETVKKKFEQKKLAAERKANKQHCACQSLATDKIGFKPWFKR